MNAHRCGLALVCFSVLLYVLCQATGEQSCAQGFQSWDTVNATGRTPTTRQYIFPSLNFSCGGVIRSWALKRFEQNSGRVLVGEMIALQLWRQKAGAASIHTLQTQQTHTARTSNAPSYAFTASPPMTVSAGDVFGFYIPSGAGTGGGLRVATAALSSHTVFISQTAAPPTEFTVINNGARIFPLVSIEFTPLSTLTSSTKEIAGATTSTIEPTSDLFPEPVSSSGSGSASATSTASAEQTTTSQPHSISAPMAGFPSSAAETGGRSVDDLSSPDGFPVPIIVGVVVAVFVATVLLALVVAAIICYKIKLLKKYKVRSCARSNGVPPPEASTCTAVTMQGNPSYTVVEEGMTLEPNPCYTPMQAISVYEPFSGVPPPEASTCTAVTMQGNPSYTVVEEGMTLEPNPCYTPMQANSVYIRVIQ